MLKLNVLKGLENILDGYCFDGNMLYKTDANGELSELDMYVGTKVNTDGTVDVITEETPTFLFMTGEDKGMLVDAQEVVEKLEEHWGYNE